MKLTTKAIEVKEQFKPFKVELEFNTQADVDAFLESVDDTKNCNDIIYSYDIGDYISYNKVINKITQAVKFPNL